MKTSVTFRKFPDGEVIAIFPYIEETDTCVLSYMHEGQHSQCFIGLLDKLQIAKPSEYYDLFEELEQIGYDLQIID